VTKLTSLQSAAPKQRSHGKLILPFLSAGLLVAGATLLIRESMDQPHTASMVTRQLRDLALQRAVRPGQDDGGFIGPWRISAVSYDPMTGELKNFRLKSGPVELAAASAKILVDPEADSIGFELHRLVYTVLPNESHPERTGELVELNNYTLGPVPYGREIVPDAGSMSVAPIKPKELPQGPLSPPIASVTE